MSDPVDRPDRAAEPEPAVRRPTAFYVSSALHDRLKGAWWGTRTAPDGSPSLSGLLERALVAEAARLEERYHGGTRFPPPARTASGRTGGEPGPRHHSYYLPAGLRDRIRAAWWGTRATSDAAPSLSAVVTRVMAAEATRLEQAHNAGRRFDPAPVGARGTDPEAARRQSRTMAARWAERRSHRPGDASTEPADDVIGPERPPA